MLKQSLVQEKLSDLINIEKSASMISTTGVKSDLKLSDTKKTGTDLLPSQYNMPQWPRVQLDKKITSNLKHNSNSQPITNNSSSPNHESSIQNLTNSRYGNKSAKTIKNLSNDNASSGNVNEKIGFDGDETVDFYSKNSHGRRRGGGGEGGSASGRDRGGSFPNGNNNLGLSLNNPSGQNSNSNSLNNFRSQGENNNNTSSHISGLDPGGEGSSPSVYDLTMKLRYLEKSIKFIQQQHSETLTSLHQEIEKLKSENRGKQINVIFKRQNNKLFLSSSF